MPGHTYWRTITANRKSITKASSSLFDFSSMLPKLGETQARYVSPAARPAPASLPHRPLPSPRGATVAPLSPPVSTEYSTKAAAAPFPASFLPGRLSAVASAAHTHPSPLLHPAGPWPPPPRKNPGSLPRCLGPRRIPPVPVSALLNSRPPLSGTRCFPLGSLQLPSPSHLAHGTLRGSGPQSPPRARAADPKRGLPWRLSRCPPGGRWEWAGVSGFPWRRGKEPAGFRTLQAEAALPFPAERRGGSRTAVSCALSRSRVPQPGHRRLAGTLSLTLQPQLPSLFSLPRLTLDPEREPQFRPQRTWKRD